MKKYTPRSIKWLALLAFFGVAVLITGLAFIIVNSSNIFWEWGFILTIAGGQLSIIFLGVFFADKSRYLTLDDEKMVLPRGAFKNGERSLKRTVIKINEICSIKSESVGSSIDTIIDLIIYVILTRVFRITSKDTYFHTLFLKDGTKIAFYLYEYGKEAEKEILKIIKNSI